MVLRFPDLISVDDVLKGKTNTKKNVSANYGRQTYSFHAAASNGLHDPLHGGPYIQPKDANYIGTLSGVVSDSTCNPILLSNRHVMFIHELGAAGGALLQPPSPPSSTKFRVVGYTKTRKTPAGINFPLK
mgnify:FL=1